MMFSNFYYGEKMKKEERFSWILSSLQIIGFFDRKKYLEVFQVSPGQVTQDLDGFCDLFNTKKLAVSRHVSITSKRGILLKNERTGETSHDARLFWPLEIEGCRPWDVEDWFIRTYKEKYIDVQTYIMAPKSPEIFNQIVRAMVNEKRVKMLYDSPTSGEKFRTVSFLKVVRAVGRLHIFSYDHDKNEYRDFAVGRMLSLELQKQDSFVKTSPELINKKLSQKKELSLLNHYNYVFDNIT